MGTSLSMFFFIFSNTHLLLTDCSKTLMYLSIICTMYITCKISNCQYYVNIFLFSLVCKYLDFLYCLFIGIIFLLLRCIVALRVKISTLGGWIKALLRLLWRQQIRKDTFFSGTNTVSCRNSTKQMTWKQNGTTSSTEYLPFFLYTGPYKRVQVYLTFLKMRLKHQISACLSPFECVISLVSQWKTSLEQHILYNCSHTQWSFSHSALCRISSAQQQLAASLSTPLTYIHRNNSNNNDNDMATYIVDNI